ncbi:MAG: NADH-quinone oxidoreductase subunit NuoK, partial [Armatimonadetes bacterium]|nr:NADH-quinone oxidoreductase subunit NuoK [Armatimonadota bacterium]
MTLNHYLFLSILLFSLGIYGVLTRKNAVAILMSIELIFNAVNINLIAFDHFLKPANIIGQIFTIFIITIAAAEAVAGIAIILSLYN